MWIAFLAQVPEVKPAADNSLYFYIGGGVAGLILLFLVYKLLFGKSGAVPDLQKDLNEDLSEYPPAPKANAAKISIHGVKVRVRLIVVCPTGSAANRIDTDDLEEVLDGILHGLGSVIANDKPRVKVWPPQLSLEGFAPTFHRVVESPDPLGAKSPWILAAGPTRSAGKPMLLGLALYAETPVKFGQMTLTGKEWQETLRVER